MKTTTPLLRSVLRRKRYGLLFDNSNDVLTLPAGVPISSKFVTVECWVRITAFKDFNNLVRNNWINSGWALYATAAGGFNFSCAQAGVQTGAGIAGGQVGRLYHLVGVYDGAAVRLYRDGVSSTPTALVGATLDTGFAISVGNAANCLLDELRIYNRALSATEVAEHFAGHYSNEAGLVGYWGLDDGSGTSATDLSTYGNHGTLANGPTWTECYPVPGDERKFRMADLYTITLVDGTVARYTNADVDLTVGGNVYSSQGPLFMRTSTREVVGIEVGEMTVNLAADANRLLAGVPWLKAMREGVLDGASIELRRAFLIDWRYAVVGTIVKFSGRVAALEAGRLFGQITVKSDMEILNTDWPPLRYQSGCRNKLFATRCTLTKEDFAVSSSATSGSTVSQVNCGLTFANDHFTLGTITWLTGANAGLTRTVKKYTTGVFRLTLPLPVAPTPGDTFKAYPGCDKRQASCGIRSAIVFTVNASTNRLLANAHGIAPNEALFVAVTGGTLASPLSTATRYFAVNVTANDLQVSLTPGGAAVDLTTTGSGTQRIVQHGKFANIDNFRAEPYVPVPETVL